MTVVQTKTCVHCGASFDITQEDMDFYNKISPRFPSSSTPLTEGGQGGADATTRGDYVAQIPTPTLCPDCRLRRRLAFRNERNLYVRECDASKKPIVSIYSPDKGYKTYDQKIRWSDSWDPMDYGFAVDFSKTFTEQFGKLMYDVPMCPLTTEFTEQENCDYTNSAGPGKNCYMTFEMAFCENAIHSKSVWNSTNILDCTYCDKMDSAYGCLDSVNCSFSTYLNQCRDCSFSHHCYDCVNCHYCYNCSHLEGKKYCIENKEYGSKEAYEKALASYVFRKIAYDKLPSGKLYGNDNVSHAFNVTNSKDSSYVTDGWDLENVKYASDVFGASDCYDYYSRGENVSMGYELAESGRNVSQAVSLYLCWGNVHNVYYSFYCNKSSNLFGCIGLRNKEYCIFNKQYTKEEYNELVPRIIEHMKKTGEWGEFFHPSLSPFGYNETVANEYFPVQKAPSGKLEAVSSDGEAGGLELSAYGYRRSDYEAPAPQVDKIVSGEKLPVQGCAIIQEKKPEFLQDILKYAIRCEKSQKLFRLIPQEIAFYTKHDLPLPRRHPDVRHAERMEMRR